MEMDREIDDKSKKLKKKIVMLIVFIGILPRMTDSLHPGNGGNPGFDTYALDNNMKLVFYPAVLGWILLGLWIASVRIRISKIKENLEL